ncbi:LacI family DNA-binding transcriptional regulator [Rhizobium rhizogenes]|uniref:LacI family transcriptional regulator n=2 Tax=Rhizobium/Agrobacterium group TaxID=227290 RepID=A0AA92BZD8_RHIRH|nr:LacI family DNA-binding transcriptional regulator [Rhizobium rhizogenes]PVE50341.1 LacI family transcriptional regulator [Rhizobium rhizogenes]PVE62234.1 LacI family transcriptional regulator [Agrobacterium tumefaciens]PVE70415.1 LacI family transcriptional regulator [Sphingomonas sp. TPD3009]
MVESGVGAGAEALADVQDASSRVTIKDVAAAAGVSISTASKALNERGRMSGETRERIQAVAQKMGFRPNAMARALVGQRSFTLGLLTSDTYGRFTLPIAAGLSVAMADRGVSVFLCAIDDDPERVRSNIEAMEDKRVDGLVVSGKRIDRVLPVDLPTVHMPVVYVNAACPDGAIGFVPDDEGGAHAAVFHLVGMGRKRIAHITGPRSFSAVGLREQGWQRALSEAALPCFGEALSGEWSERFGYEAGQRFVTMPSADRPDAVFCGNDQIARGLIDALTLSGIRVPQDIAVVGFDNWEIFAAATRPPLTTVDMALKELGRQAGITLLDLIDGKPVEAGQRRLACRLMVRESCGASISSSD